MRKFEFNKSYEEIEIAGKVYKISLKDDDRKSYGKQLGKFHDVLVRVQNADTKELSMDDALALEEEVKEITLCTVDAILGEGVGQELYEKSDKQVDELLPILFGVAEVMQERREEKFKKYVNKQKKK